MTRGKQIVVAAFLGALAAAGAQAIVAGQVDTFESGATEGWASGTSHPAPPAVQVTGGPNGEGDHYLLLTAIGSGPGGKLVAFNQAQWTGDYTAAGIASISMDVNNFGITDLALRLSIGDSPGGASPNRAITAAVAVPAGQGWTSVSFPVDAASLTAVSGTVAVALANAREVRLQHSPDTTGPVNIVASLGVDNIRAHAAAPPFTLDDLVAVLQIAAGWRAATSPEAQRLNIEDPTGSPVDLIDAARLARKLAGLEANP